MDITEDNIDIKQEFKPDINSTEIVFETIKLPTKPTVQTKSIAIWSNEETKKLIDLYQKFMTDIGPFNRFKRKKDMWSEISANIPNKSPKQCEERLKTILRRKKKGVIEKVYISNTKRKLMNIEAEGENDLSISRKQKINSKSNESIITYKSWSNNETRLLVELYKNFINNVGPQKRFKHKRDMWDQISANFDDKDPRQCELRFNNILRKKKPNTTKSFITRRKTIDFKPRHNIKKSNLLQDNIDEVEDDINEVEDDINEVVADINEVEDEMCEEEENIINGMEPSVKKINKVELEDGIIPENIVEPQKKKEYNEQSRTTVVEPEINERFSIGETLEKIANRKEEGKERRHRERMEAMSKLQFILQQVIIATKK